MRPETSLGDEPTVNSTPNLRPDALSIMLANQNSSRTNCSAAILQTNPCQIAVSGAKMRTIWIVPTLPVPTKLTKSRQGPAPPSIRPHPIEPLSASPISKRPERSQYSRSISEKNVTEPEHKPRKPLTLMNLLGAPDRTKKDYTDLQQSETRDINEKRRSKFGITS